jgi:molybdopterin-binding protein
VISARNQLEGTIKSVKLGTIMAEVVAQVGQFEIVSAITRASAESMHLQAGDRVRIVIKATEVMVAKD